MSTKVFLIVTTLIEVTAGVALLAVPSLFAHFLIGEELSSAAALVVARVAGSALLSLALACWLGRNNEGRSQKGLIGGMLIYNLAVTLVLLHAWITWSVRGIGLWPASILHTVLFIWCLVCLTNNQRTSMETAS